MTSSRETNKTILVLLQKLNRKQEVDFVDTVMKGDKHKLLMKQRYDKFCDPTANV